MGVVRPAVQKALATLSDLPTDIEPVFVTANAMSAPPPGAPTAVGAAARAGSKMRKPATKPK